MSSDIITWPSEAEIPSVAHKFEKLGKISYIFGAIDGTYCKIEAPKLDPVAYINRKCFFSLILQAICDSDIPFLLLLRLQECEI
jgi:hypothetical protein